MYKISFNTGQSWQEVSSSQFANVLQDTFGKNWETCLRLADKYNVVLMLENKWFKIEKPKNVGSERLSKNVRLMRDTEKYID